MKKSIPAKPPITTDHQGRYKPGDRVEVRWSNQSFVGTVIGYYVDPGWPTYLLVRRDDGLPGTGPAGAWCASDDIAFPSAVPAPAQVSA